MENVRFGEAAISSSFSCGDRVNGIKFEKIDDAVENSDDLLIDGFGESMVALKLRFS